MLLRSSWRQGCKGSMVSSWMSVLASHSSWHLLVQTGSLRNQHLLKESCRARGLGPGSPSLSPSLVTVSDYICLSGNRQAPSWLSHVGSFVAKVRRRPAYQHLGRLTCCLSFLPCPPLQLLKSVNYNTVLPTSLPQLWPTASPSFSGTVLLSHPPPPPHAPPPSGPHPSPEGRAQVRAVAGLPPHLFPLMFQAFPLCFQG